MSLNGPITIDEIRFTMATTEKRKALGCDDIPLEVLQSEQCSRYLLTLLNCCFSTGSILEICSRGIINPILTLYSPVCKISHSVFDHVQYSPVIRYW